jgi:hypothetical protein
MRDGKAGDRDQKYPAAAHDQDPVAIPRHCDGVFAVIDTAIKTAYEHDGTAVVYYAIDNAPQRKLTILDWDIQKIGRLRALSWSIGFPRFTKS